MRVIQICARLEFGDAVSKHVLEIDRALKSWGLETGVFANTLDEFGSQVGRPDSEYQPGDNTCDLLIYHYSLYCPNYKQYLETRCKRILIYHNITPPVFFASYDKGVAEFCRSGRELLSSLNVCDLALGDSEFNRLELMDRGFEPDRTGVLPIFVDYESLKRKAEMSGPMSGFQDSFNVLFVGRAVPNKRIEDVLRTFYYYNHCVNSDSHLFLVGPSWIDRYDAQLRWLIDSLGLWANVHLTGRVSEEDLASFYAGADAFLCMSEHEGFGVPLVESMAFDLPVVAFSATAVPFTLGGAGITFNRKDFPMVGELLESIRTDAGLRKTTVGGMRDRLSHFAPDSVRRILKDSIERVLGGLS